MHPTQGSRIAHWVLKIGDLKRSLTFFEGVLGLRVLRHEEFEEGCEATCNGPYGGAWSKTMVGYGAEAENFALELTYNYGIGSYDFGNDLQYIALCCPFAFRRAEALGFAFDEAKGLIHGPDNYVFKIVPGAHGRMERFACISLRVSDLTKSVKYWSSCLGLSESLCAPGTDSPFPSKTLAFSGKDQVKLQLIEVQDGHGVDHAFSAGRVAFSCPTNAVNPIHDMVIEKGGTVLTAPLTLSTPGKAEVVVTILADPDGYEICFVEDEAFYELATPTYDLINWDARKAKGGDGAPLPQAPALTLGEGLVSVTSDQDLAGLIARAGDFPVVLEFGATWCLKCRFLTPKLETLVSNNTKVSAGVVDVDESAELAELYGVTKVPHVVILKGGDVVASMPGPTLQSIEDNLASLS